MPDWHYHVMLQFHALPNVDMLGKIMWFLFFWIFYMYHLISFKRQSLVIIFLLEMQQNGSPHSKIHEILDPFSKYNFTFNFPS